MALLILLFLPSRSDAEMFALGRVRPPGSVLPPRRSSEGSRCVRECDERGEEKDEGRWCGVV